MLLNRVKEKSDALQSGKRVAFRGVLEKMGMYNGNERDIKTNCFAHRALICSAIAKIIDGFKYILDVNENTGKKLTI